MIIIAHDFDVNIFDKFLRWLAAEIPNGRKMLQIRTLTTCSNCSSLETRQLVKRAFCSVMQTIHSLQHLYQPLASILKLKLSFVTTSVWNFKYGWVLISFFLTISIWIKCVCATKFIISSNVFREISSPHFHLLCLFNFDNNIKMTWWLSFFLMFFFSLLTQQCLYGFILVLPVFFLCVSLVGNERNLYLYKKFLFLMTL